MSPLIQDAMLATLHHTAVLLVFGLLLAEAILLRLKPEPIVIRLLARTDLAYGLAAGGVILAGIARVALGIKGPDYYLHNPLFWAKILVFICIGLISINPTMHYVRWERALREHDRPPASETWANVRNRVHAELLLFPVLLLLAALMARGVG
jgi:putative membrane protein